jgi:CubicO group peptidase (beta-lactamase class C family)
MSRFDTYSQYIEDAMRSWDCPGAAVAVLQGEDLLYQGVFGWRDVKARLALTADTRFAMASCTKSFTAMSAALLVDEGKLEWDKPVREYMPEFILNDPYVTEHITVRDMLSHRTGMPRHDLAAWRLDISRAEFVQRMRHLKFNLSFREKFQYNNLMYYAAGHLVEKLAGQKWEDFVQTRIFEPLGMQASNFIPEPPQAGQVNALGYRVEREPDGSSKRLVNLPFGLHTELSPGSAGALFSTLADLIQWLKVHVNNGRVDDFQLVSPENLKQMHLPQTVIPGGGITEALMENTITSYGMGWFIEPYRGYTLIQHGGNVEGHSLMIGFLPREKIGVVVLTNIAEMPLRDVLLYESLDRALDLPDRKWNTKFHLAEDPIILGEARNKQTAQEEKLENAPTTHPLEHFVGTYASPGYPDFAVRLQDNHLQACTLGSLNWSELRHYHYDVFEWYLADFDFWVKVRFLVDDNGSIDSVSIPIEPAVDNVIFTRKPPELDQAILDALVGEYHTPVDGLAFTITVHAGKVYAAQTGSAPEEIKAYTLGEHLVGFRLKRDRLDFLRTPDGVNRIIIKTPDLTIEARREGKL